MTRRAFPPSLPEKLIRKSVSDRAVADSIVGDLRQEFYRKVRAGRTQSARIWYWQQALALATRYRWSHLNPATSPTAIAYASRPHLRQRLAVMQNLFKDFVYAVRGYRNRLGLVALAVLALALGIGLTTAMFGVTNGLLLNSLPFEDGNRIVSIVRNQPSVAATFLQTVPIREYSEWVEQQSSFEEIAAFTHANYNLSTEGNPERIIGAEMTPSAFRVLRIQPEAGRLFREEDARSGAPRVAIIGFEVWRDRFDLDRGVLGRTIRLDGYETEIIGVMPQGFEFPAVHRVWTPMELNPLEAAPNEGALQVFGRLADGVSEKEAATEFNAIHGRLAAEDPETHAGITVEIRPYVEQYVGPQAKPLMLAMLGAVSFVLLIACANVANLLLARALQRNREVAIRTALGAGRGRLIVSHLMEAFVLVLFGAIGGFALAQVGIDLFYDSLTTTIRPFWLHARVEPEVLGFVGLLMLIATIFSGALPALRASGTDVNEVLKDEARGSSGLKLGRVSKGLVIAQIALSTALLVGAGLMIKSVNNFGNFDLGFETENVFTATLSIGEGDFDGTDARLRFLQRAEEQIATIPGVVEAGFTSELPVIGVSQGPYEVEGEVYANDQERPRSRLVLADEGMFETFGVGTMSGRDFTSGDRMGAPPVILVNRSFARRQFGQESPLNKRIKFANSQSSGEWFTVVGVIPDLYLEERFSLTHPAAAYIPLAQAELLGGDQALQSITLVARTELQPTQITAEVRETVAQLNPNIPLYDVQSYGTALQQALVGVMVIGSIFTIFGVVALFLAAVGLYGVISFSARQRTRELGIRIAFGARARDTFGLVLKDGAKQLALGLAAGLLLGQGLARAIQVVLFDVNPRDPVLLATVAVILSLTALAATVIPARRASRIDPMLAIRSE